MAYIDCDPDRNRDAFFDILSVLVKFFAEDTNIDSSLRKQDHHGTLRNIMQHETLTCPSAGPRGGEGEAFPAGIYIRKVPNTFAVPLAARLAAISAQLKYFLLL